MKIKNLFTALISLTVLNCCKKNNDNFSTQEKILGKWKVLRIVAIDEATGAYQRGPYNGTSSDYIDYRSDGQVYSYVEGIADTSTYNIVNDSTIFENGMTLQIRSLTNSELTKASYVLGFSYTRIEYLYR